MLDFGGIDFVLPFECFKDEFNDMSYAPQPY